MEKSFSEYYVDDGHQFEINNSAILIVDMLNDFCTTGGLMPLSSGHEIIPMLQKLIEGGRQAGLPIIFVNDCHRADKSDLEFNKRTPHCIEGTWGAQVIDELRPQAGDYQISKRRFSGFFQTDLDLVLRELAVRTVIVTGVVTNICVRSTCHDAFFLGYNVIVPEDGVRATGNREQASSLWDIATHFGTVTTIDEILKKIKMFGH